MPSRNYAIITETDGAGTSFAPNGDPSNVLANGNGNFARDALTKESVIAKNGHSPLHEGEEGAGTTHMVASGVDMGRLRGGLDVSIRVEINQHDREGKTEGYGFSSKPVPLKHLEDIVLVANFESVPALSASSSKV